MAAVVTTCTRMLLIFLNTILLISGLTLLGLALYVFFGEPVGRDDELLFFIIFLIACGVMVSVIALIGSFGVIFDSSACLGLYIVILTLLCACQVAATVFGFAYQEAVVEFVHRKLTTIDGLNKRKGGEASNFTLVNAVLIFLRQRCRPGAGGGQRCVGTTTTGEECVMGTGDPRMCSVGPQFNRELIRKTFLFVIVGNIAAAVVTLFAIFGAVSLCHVIRRKNNRIREF